MPHELAAPHTALDTDVYGVASLAAFVVPVRGRAAAAPTKEKVADGDEKDQPDREGG